MATIRSQEDQRRFQKYTDQHGRKWSASVEKESGHPCTPIQPGFLAPIVPPQMYITLGVPEDPPGEETPGRVTIAYDRWITDLDNADREWVRKCHETGTELYKDQFDPDAQFNVAILNRVGARPHVPKAITPLRAKPCPGAASLPVYACKQSNAWALGLLGPKGEAPKVPALLKDFFTKVERVVPVFEDTFEADEVDLEAEELAPKKRGNAEALARYRSQQKAGAA